MGVYEKSSINSHGYVFDIVKTKFGLNITHQGQWIWRAKTVKEARRIVRKTGLKYMRDNL